MGYKAPFSPSHLVHLFLLLHTYQFPLRPYHQLHKIRQTILFLLIYNFLLLPFSFSVLDSFNTLCLTKFLHNLTSINALPPKRESRPMRATALLHTTKYTYQFLSNRGRINILVLSMRKTYLQSPTRAF
ncbi:hypothetical protein FOPG_16548 [Fusarium oxysporum f. sp. conglutinans race 2 54008]|uniref:Uncharacterized protein n=1 Tax=Fusarium oxysporum f. sp. conglutinans race 2 54008 TaxID=1089457 RepID=X0H602_FUSOX|nr:hypothetical protein FOPG_16548 [Fusarium oxysporum f. sp. conglutinans race 2 54008]